MPFPTYGDLSSYFSGQINRSTEYLSRRFPSMSGPIGRWGGYAAKHPMASLGVTTAAAYGAGNVAIGSGTVMGTMGYGIAGGLLGAGAGAATQLAANTAGSLALGGGELGTGLGRSAKYWGVRGAAAGLLFGAVLGSNSAPNRFSGF